VILGPNRPNETIKLGLLADDAHKMRDLGDHAASLKRVRQLGDTANPVELEPDQGLPLLAMPRGRKQVGLPHARLRLDDQRAAAESHRPYRLARGGREPLEPDRSDNPQTLLATEDERIESDAFWCSA